MANIYVVFRRDLSRYANKDGKTSRWAFEEIFDQRDVAEMFVTVQKERYSAYRPSDTLYFVAEINLPEVTQEQIEAIQNA